MNFIFFKNYPRSSRACEISATGIIRSTACGHHLKSNPVPKSRMQNIFSKSVRTFLPLLFYRIVGQTDGLSQQSKIQTRSPRKNRYTPSSTKPSSLAHLLQLIPFEKTNEPHCYRPSHCDRTRLLRLHPGQRYQHACCDSVSYHHLIADEAYPSSSC